ncbi:RidA family protein [Oscillibacter sp. MSJ-2]|uniref:RidA family protein n=1 Tax=Dysosmobacter acutus TaxID=2841504 RepID=A0ABS6F6Y9_9FIRM|nr:RidA family protein [Dysosmobacter acutus]MBU5625357.1 RidA family protein [Dysosmobacter acutus]
MKQFIPPKKEGSPFSMCVWAGNTLYISGKVGIDPSTGTIPDSAEEQTRFAISGLSSVLEEQGCTLADVVKITAILTDQKDIAPFNKVYCEQFAKNPPARTLMVVGALAGKATVELDAVAVKD